MEAAAAKLPPVAATKTPPVLEAERRSSLSMSLPDRVGAIINDDADDEGDVDDNADEDGR